MRFSPTLRTSNSSHNLRLKLSAIFTSKHTKRVTINGITAKQGEIILSNIKILKISHSSVKIQQNGINRTLYLLPKFKKKMRQSKTGLQQ